MAKPDKSADSVDYEFNTDSVTAGKGHATPTRKEREAANLRPLVNSDRKAASKASRAKMAESRERARIGMANGEEKYLVARDRGPQRRFIHGSAKSQPRFQSSTRKRPIRSSISGAHRAGPVSTTGPGPTPGSIDARSRSPGR